jgi:hypothetical protein
LWSLCPRAESRSCSAETKRLRAGWEDCAVRNCSPTAIPDAHAITAQLSIRAQPNNSAPQLQRASTRLRRRSAGDANGWQGCVRAMDWRCESCPPAFGAFPRAAIWRLSILPSRFWLLRSSVGLVWLRSLPPAFLQTATIPRCAPSWFVDSAQQALRCLCFLSPCKFKL